MNTDRKSLPWMQLALTFVIFVIVLGLAIAYQDQLRDFVLTPTLYFLWVGELALKSFDQQCIWLLTLIMALFISLLYSRRSARQPDKGPSQSHVPRARSQAAGRIHFWRTQVRISGSTIYARSYRRSEFRRLVIKALAYQENREDEKVRELIRSGQIRLPAEVSFILGIEDQPIEPVQPTSWSQRLQQELGWMAARFKEPDYSSDPKLEKVVDYLENLMEVNNDAGNR